MTKTVSERIQLTLTQVDGAKAGKTPQKRYLPDAVGLDKPAEIASQMVVYDKGMPAMLETVTMYNTGDNGENESVFHFGLANQTVRDTRSYRMWLGNYPDFTFQVEFSEDNTQLD